MDTDVNAKLTIQHPPEGAWLVSDRNGTTIGATNRNLLDTTGFCFFALFWNGLLSVFVACNISCTLHHLGLPIPRPLPTVKMEDGGEVTLRMTLLLWVWITPFILIGICLAAAFLSNLFGRTEVRIIGDEGVIYIGVGKLGWKRRFAVPQIKSVNLHRGHNSEGSDTMTVQLETTTGEKIRFGSLLSDERRQFVLAGLRDCLFPQKHA